MSEHPINSLLDTSLKKIKEMIDVNTIIGDPITTPDGTTIIPVSKVSYGFASGGSGAGVTIQPIGFLSIIKGNVKFIPIEKYDGAADRIVGMIPEAFDKISSFIKKDQPNKTDLEKDPDSFDA